MSKETPKANRWNDYTCEVCGKKQTTVVETCDGKVLCLKCHRDGPSA